jgi:hypothetical protein
MEIYVSTDIEADGPVPGMNSMLSFASAAYQPDKQLIAKFSANLELLPGATSDPNTMAWWQTKQEAWDACRKNTRSPQSVMSEYVSWLKDLPGLPVFVGYPAAFDFMFVTYYLYRFAGESPFSYFALDIRTYAMALMKKPFSDISKSAMPSRWFDNLPYTHVALDDAISQGALFCNMLAENINAGPPIIDIYDQENG